MQWHDQVAIVTGGGRGIGRAIAIALARHGASVCVNYTARAAAAEAVVAEIAAQGGTAIACRADVADPAAVAAMRAETEAALGPVSILVNNAGLPGQGDLEAYDPAQVARMRAVNVDGVIHAVRAVMAGMKARGHGRIVNISSIAAFGTSLPGTTFYAATKAEVMALTKRFAAELGPFGITVNAVAPGFVKSDMTQGSHDAASWAAVEAKLAALAMTRRIGAPQDIARAVAFLAAPDAGWITAQTIAVDGGRMDYTGHG